ncbi:hypothetical protein [Clostridioides difficile]|uniref:hypothetical protein n=1 Tax=Clostridioides difficile TaxID=1496 RepID=UPI001F224FA7|nr:hypothetical protein [Clostridioides difficile]
MAGNLNNMRAVNNFRGDKSILECLVSFEGRSISQRKVRVFFKEKQNQIEIDFAEEEISKLVENVVLSTSYQEMLYDVLKTTGN